MKDKPFYVEYIKGKGQGMRAGGRGTFAWSAMRPVRSRGQCLSKRGIRNSGKEFVIIIYYKSYGRSKPLVSNTTQKEESQWSRTGAKLMLTLV